MTEILLLVFALLLVLACGIFVAAEFALVTVNRNTVEEHAKRGDRQAKGVLQALRSLSTQLSGAQVGITITNLAIGFLAEPAIAALLEHPLALMGVPQNAVPSIAIITGIALATVVTMVFGELVPKNIALARPLATARLVQRPQRLFSHGMRVPIRLLNASANAVLRRMGITPQEELASARSADELSSLVRRSAEHGTLPKETALMLERSLVFDELTALDVMTPRIRMHTVQQSDPVGVILQRAKETGRSRFPVIGKSLDDIVGIVHIKDVFRVPSLERPHTTARSIMQAPVVVPSSVPLDRLLKTLRQGGLQMAVVIDEFGGTDGIVTIEDVLEELVDEVHDEHDSDAPILRRRGGAGWTLSGLLRPDEVSEAIDIFLPEDADYDTIGGLVTDRLERIPVVGDAVRVRAVDRAGQTLAITLTVERMDGRRVDKVRMRIVPQKGSAA